ncbi:MAG: hypothetical protein MUC81_01350 [Bacteroidia bacterium]|nr:hypothetical protein [Bacteroidia bacterium]
MVISNGVFLSNGNCTPALFWGLEMMKDKSWVKVVDLSWKVSVNCGPGTYKFSILRYLTYNN